MTSKNSEQVLEGNSLTADVGLPLVQRLAVVRSHSADRITWHAHPCYEVILLGDGATAYEFKGAGTAELSGGQFIVIPPNLVHRGLNDVRKPALLCGVMIETKSGDAVNHTPFAKEDIDWIGQQLANAPLSPRKMSQELQVQAKELTKLISEFDRSSRMSIIRTRLKICKIVFEIASQLDSVVRTETTDMVEEAIRLMKQQLDNPTSINQLALNVGCSRAKLFEVFKESTGLTPNDYWQRLRIEQAYQSVANTRESMTAIALNCGFSSSQYFCTVFRKYYGISPRECRKGSTRRLSTIPARQSASRGL